MSAAPTPPGAPLAVDVLTGEALIAALPQLARLRIEVFRDFPYLYDGTLDYEQHYLEKFAAAPGAVCVIARDTVRSGGPIVGGPIVGGPIVGGPIVGGPIVGGPIAGEPIVGARTNGGMIVGASTGAPLMEHDPQFAAPFMAHGYDPARIFYCSESVLQKGYRGRGLGHAFFEGREAHARRLGGFTHSAFASVVRPADHPLRPADYQPLDAFWTKRGYTKADGIVATYAWKDIDQPGETVKEMQFWIKPL